MHSRSVCYAVKVPVTAATILILMTVPSFLLPSLIRSLFISIHLQIMITTALPINLPRMLRNGILDPE